MHQPSLKNMRIETPESGKIRTSLSSSVLGKDASLLSRIRRGLRVWLSLSFAFTRLGAQRGFLRHQTPFLRTTAVYILNKCLTSELLEHILTVNWGLLTLCVQCTNWLLPWETKPPDTNTIHWTKAQLAVQRQCGRNIQITHQDSIMGFQFICRVLVIPRSE